MVSAASPSSLVPLLLFAFAMALPCGAADKPLERIAFGSCAHQDRPQPIWEAVIQSRPDLFILLGDNIYADTTDPLVMKAAYDRFAAVEGYKNLKKFCPVLATWDDHDYGQDNAGADYPMKKVSQSLFLDFFDVPKDSSRRQQSGVYSASLLGPPDKLVQIILLDTRTFKTQRELLGEDQWRWLEEQMLAPAQVRVVGSSIQVLADQYKAEKWADYPKERRRLLRLLQKKPDVPVLLISGDRHYSEISKINQIGTSSLYEFTSSSLNATDIGIPVKGFNQYRVGELFDQSDSFGVIKIDWRKRIPSIRFELVDVAGKIATIVPVR